MAAKKTAAPTVADVIGSVEKEAYSNVADTAPEISAQADEPKGVFLPLATAKKIYELYNSIEAADAHFHSCQSTNFREHVRSVIKAPKVNQAFADLKGWIESVEGGK
ncbi:MAG: hypothetical protein IKH75_01105 [Ruminococcus sp.]|nr:hypothetical protein [Ruminococcus sp.]